MRKCGWIVGLLALMGLSLSAAQAQNMAPTDATQSILDVFGSYDIVAMDDGMNIQQAADFYSALVTNPTFAANVGNVVIDFGDAAHQDTVDQYLAGQDVADSDLQQVWIETGGFNFGGANAANGANGTPAVPESYGQFLAAIRQANQTLPDNQKIHVWLGAEAFTPPQGGNGGNGGNAGGNGGFRGAGVNGGQFMANLIETQILSQGKKALVIARSALFNPNGEGFGGRGQFSQNGNGGGNDGQGTPAAPGNGNPPGNFTPQQNVRQILDTDYPGKTIVAVLHRGMAEADCNTNLENLMASWTPPVIAIIPGTQLQTMLSDPNCHELGSFGSATASEGWADGYLYLGPVASLTMSPTSDGQQPTSYLDYIQQMEQLRQQLQQQFQQTPQATPAGTGA